MSYGYVLLCDAPDCDDVSGSPGSTREEAAENARLDGWLIEGKWAFCRFDAEERYYASLASPVTLKRVK